MFKKKFTSVHRKFAGRGAARGQSVIEIIASLLMFVIMLTVMISISLYLYVQHAVVTVAREGARFASLNTDVGDADTQDLGVLAVQQYVVDSTRQLTGIDINPSDVTVTPPDPAGVQGERTVRVDVRFLMNNPIPADAFLSALGASGSSNTLDNIPISGTATMHYEE